MNPAHENGFTLYELLVTMMIIGIVLAIGVPNMSAFTANSRITTTANELHSSFMLARSEAARSKSNITICASTNSMNAAAACGGHFKDGWIIFVDSDGDVQRAGITENVLRRHPAIHDSIDININDDATYFSFAPSGLGRGDVFGPSFQTAILCDDRGNKPASGNFSSARFIVVTPIGRATVVRDVDIIAAKGGCP